jgi:hypothetical protein
MSKNTSVRRSAALLSVAAMATTGLIATAVPASAVITQGTGGNDANGAPLVFQDDQGVAVQMCLDEAVCAEPVDPADPPADEPVFPAPESEAAYFAAEATAGPVLAIYGIEALADAAGAVSVANVARFRADGLSPNAEYTIRGPWGTVTATTDVDGELEHLIETGGEAGGTVQSGHVKTFLRRVGAAPGLLGDINAPGPVVGSPTGFNRVVVRGPNGALVGRTSTFTVAGQMAPDTAMTSVATQSLNLGNTRKSTPTVVNIPVSSFGTADAAVTAVKSGANPGQFAVVNNCATVASGAACNIRVTYTPRANRNASAILTIDDNGLAAPRQVTLTGVAQDTRAPQLQSRTPGKGATVRPGKSVKVQFSEAVRGLNRSTFTLVDRSNNRKVAATVSKRGNSYVLNPRRALKRGTSYSVKLNGGARQIRDLANNGARDVQWRFRTR